MEPSGENIGKYSGTHIKRGLCETGFDSFKRITEHVISKLVSVGCMS